MRSILPTHLLRRFISSSGSRCSPPTAFRYIDEGQGATLRFREPLQHHVQYDREAQQRIRHVGVLGVKTCVGVYFAIDDDCCFVAHINAYVQRVNPSYSTVGDRTVLNDAEADFFRTATREKFKEHAAANGRDPNRARSRILRSLLLVCPEPMGKPRDSPIPQKHLRAEQTGFYVAQGVKDFPGLPPSSPIGLLQAASGFVVRHPGGKPELAPYVQCETTWSTENEEDLEAAAPELQGYQKSPEYGVDQWTIVRQGWERR